MAVMLKTGKYLYWKLQLLGWGLSSCYWAYQAYSRFDYGVLYTSINFILDIIVGVVLTHSYHLAIKSKYQQFSIIKKPISLGLHILALAVLFMLLNNLKWHYYWTLVREKDFILSVSLFGWDPVFITGLRLMSIWVLAYHLYSQYRKEILSTKQKAALEVLEKEAKLNYLHTQLNPHFLFNSMNSIKSLIVENPKQSRRAIDLLSELLRNSLDTKQQQLTTIKNELSLVKDYIELEKLRYEDRLSVDINYAEEILESQVPIFSIQLLVENAIKHGVDKTNKNGKITITISLNDDLVQVDITNPGILEKTSRGLGLKNLQERLSIFYQGNASFKLTQASPNIVQARLMIPHKK
ncbi:histidine kinase [Spongiivirga sp. MCCC 1A20706]|uniref:sensor histidine kinase n=1 Tax=Spongiivirga sp. MCCC 1A20706 TaxID=3160963 RepID=UPI003977778A